MCRGIERERRDRTPQAGRRPVSTKAAYRSYLDRHFIPFLGDTPMNAVAPSMVQAWVTKAAAAGLSPASITKYHVMLHGVFKRAARDPVILHNPCAETELPKALPRKWRILTPTEFDRLLEELPSRFHDLVLTDIETGLRWGELVALRPRHLDFLRRLSSIEESVVEVSKRNSPTGQRVVFKPYPRTGSSGASASAEISPNGSQPACKPWT